MRLKPAVYVERRAFLFNLLTANPETSYASLQRALKEKFGHAMQQRILRSIRADFDIQASPAYAALVLTPQPTVGSNEAVVPTPGRAEEVVGVEASDFEF